VLTPCGWPLRSKYLKRGDLTEDTGGEENIPMTKKLGSVPPSWLSLSSDLSWSASVRSEGGSKKRTSKIPAINSTGMTVAATL
jgi:hypothetical protein